MTKDLVDRLRKARESLVANGVTVSEWDGSLYLEAAARIEQLTVQRDEAFARLPKARPVLTPKQVQRVTEYYQNRAKWAEIERDALQQNCTSLLEMIELMSSIPTMTDEQLRRLVANVKAAVEERS